MAKWITKSELEEHIKRGGLIVWDSQVSYWKAGAIIDGEYSFYVMLCDEPLGCGWRIEHGTIRRNLVDPYKLEQVYTKYGDEFYKVIGKKEDR